MKKKEEIKYGYICGTDWQHEMEITEIEVYPSVVELKRHSKCWKQCGIIKLEIRKSCWIEPQDFSSCDPADVIEFRKEA